MMTLEEFQSIGRIRRIIDENGTVHYVMEFPKTLHMVPDIPFGGPYANQAYYPTKPVISEWEQIPLIDFILSIQSEVR